MRSVRLRRVPPAAVPTKVLLLFYCIERFNYASGAPVHQALLLHSPTHAGPQQCDLQLELATLGLRSTEATFRAGCARVDLCDL